MTIELAEKLAKYLETKDALGPYDKQAHYGYQNVPFCIINSVFSIGAKYTGVKNVVQRYADYFQLNAVNAETQTSSLYHVKLTVSDFIRTFDEMGVERMVSEVFKNRQRTSTRNGILKAEACRRVAGVLQAGGIELITDLEKFQQTPSIERNFREIPGQKSGISFVYLLMLMGDQSRAKPDRQVLRFLRSALGTRVNVEDVQPLFEQTVGILKQGHPDVTVRGIDQQIWKLQRSS
jgi:hypothetical protein